MEIRQLFKRGISPQKTTSQTFTPSFLPFGSKIGKGTMSLSAVYRATEIISDSIASLPIKIKHITGSGHKEEYSAHPVVKILNELPGNLLSKYNLMKLLIQSVILRGNGFALIQRSKGEVTGLVFIEPGEVTINYNKEKGVLNYTTNRFGVVQPKDMIHLIKNSYDGVNGQSIISFASRSISIGNSTEETAESFFNSGCNLSGILKTKGPVTTADQLNQARDSWRTAFSGDPTTKSIAILPANLEYQPISVSAKDAQMIETRQFNIQDIARFFGISPVLLGDLSHTSYSTIEAVQLDFLIHTLTPYIVMVENEFTRKILPGTDLKIDLDDNFIMKSDKSSQASYYTSLMQNGILTVNEIRKELGYPEVEGGDKLIIAYSDTSQNTINNEEQTNQNI